VREPSVIPEMTISSISFRDDGIIEIQWSEHQDQGDHVVLMKAIMFDKTIVEEQVREFISDAVDLVYAALDNLRNPPILKRD